MRPIKRRYRFVRIGRLVPRLLSACDAAGVVRSPRSRCSACGCEYQSLNHRVICLAVEA